MHIAEKNECTGCGLCRVICPVGAVSMEKDEKGFLRPVIDENKCIQCGKCISNCPPKNPEFMNEDLPEAYAFSSDEETLKRSSSGGLFTILSEYIIRHDGIVIGAAWADNFCVEHKAVWREEDIELLNYSKYVQSNILPVYAEVRRYIDDGKTVLFSGCPCQVAAIRKYIGENERLITVDVICHGVPSDTMLRNHLEESYNLNDIEEVCFRSKDGWGSCLDIKLKNGQVIHKANGQDRFMTGFLYNFILRESCTDCRFARVPRQGDITIGDLWSAPQLNLDIPWEKGIGTVLVNSAKGKRLFENALQNTLRTANVKRIENGLNDNLFRCTSRNRYAGGRFDRCYKGENFDREVIRTMHDYDIGLVLYVSQNYGSIATNVAIVSMLKKLGQKPLLLDNLVNMSSEGERVLSGLADRAGTFLNRNDYEAVNEICDSFAVGSDISWFYFNRYSMDSNHLYFMNFADSDKKLISIAPCMNGGNGAFESPQHKRLIQHYLNRIDYVSVREKDTADMIKREFGIDAMHLADPVFLCDKKCFEDLALKADDRQTNHVFAYFLNPSDEKKELVLRIMKETGKRVVSVGDLEVENRSRLGLADCDKGQVPFEQWLAYIINSDMVITDSYHGACLSLIFHKPFAVIHNRMTHRYETLERMIEMPNAFAKNVNDFKNRERVIPEFDWEEIDRKVDARRRDSYQWVKDAIEGPLNKKDDISRELATELKNSILDKYRQKDILCGLFYDSVMRIRGINTAVDNGRCVLDGIMEYNELTLSDSARVRKEELQQISNVKEYFEAVRNNGYYVVMAAEDSCEIYWDAYMKEAGLPADKRPGFRQAYIGTTDGFTMKYEEAPGTRKLRYRGHIDIPRAWGENASVGETAMLLDVLSSGLEDITGYHTSSIMINNIDYSCKARGINGAVMDRSGNVIDVWNVDTYGDSGLNIRRNIRK